MKRHGPWSIKQSKAVYHDPWMRVVRDEVQRPDGNDGTYAVVHLKPGVCVIAVDEENTVHLTEEFHYAVGRVTLEGVSGGIDAEESPLIAARRELREELGIEATDWTPLGMVDPFTANVYSPTQLYLAEGLRFGVPDREGTELIRHATRSLSDAVSAVLDSHITHAPSCVAILKAARLLGERNTAR